MQKIDGRYKVFIEGDSMQEYEKMVEVKKRVHREHGYGQKDEAGNRILDSAMSFDIYQVVHVSKKKLGTLKLCLTADSLEGELLSTKFSRESLSTTYVSDFRYWYYEMEKENLIR